MIENPDDYYSAMQGNQGWLKILESFARFVSPKQGQLLLDIGTGPGALVNIFAANYQARVLGMDYSWVLAQKATTAYEHLQDAFVVGKLPDIPFCVDAFDIITATNVLYLLDTPEKTLVDIVRVIKPGGAFVMLNPSPVMSVATATALADERNLSGFARSNFIDWGAVAEAHVRWSVDDIEAMFGRVGLTLQDTRTRIGSGLALYARGLKQ